MDDAISESGAIDLDWISPAGLIAGATQELMLFAAVGLLIGGIDELLVDCIYLWRRFQARRRGQTGLSLHDLPPADMRFAIFVPAWDEAAVIGPMLSILSTRLVAPDLAVFVGAYPNDPATIDAVAEVAERDPRIRLVVGNRAGPTTKADCLNGLWRAMQQDEASRGERFGAVLLHDAEDVVHPGELQVLAYHLRGADAVQLPVLPLPRPGAHLVGGTYLDEFAEAHGKNLAVRSAIGASLPLAGVGCAVSRTMLDRVARARGGAPFDPASLTEDYELGLTIAAMGGRTAFADIAEGPGARSVGVHAYFPASLDTAVRQKTRWLLGIALAGWDRTGWGHRAGIGELWMRMRDRRAPLAMLVLAAAYASLLLWLAGVAIGRPPAIDGWLAVILAVNGFFLLWRLAFRAAFVARRYGAAEAWLSIPRMMVGNIVSMIAARRALFRYFGMLRGAPARWDKTAHQFPDPAAAP